MGNLSNFEMLMNLYSVRDVDMDYMNEILDISLSETQETSINESINLIMADGITDKVNKTLGEQGSKRLRSIFVIMAASTDKVPKLLMMKCFMRLLLEPVLDEVLASRTTIKTLTEIKEAGNE